MRIFNHNRTCNMSSKKVLVLQTFRFCVFVVTESVFNSEKMILNTFNFTALVYEADNRFCENVRCINNIACNSAFVLLGNCKIINSESVKNLAVRVCNCFPSISNELPVIRITLPLLMYSTRKSLYFLKSCKTSF